MVKFMEFACEFMGVWGENSAEFVEFWFENLGLGFEFV